MPRKATGRTAGKPQPRSRQRKPAPPALPKPRRPLGANGLAVWEQSHGPWLRSDTDVELLLTLCEQIDERAALRLRVLRDNDWHDRGALRALDAQVTAGLETLAELRQRAKPPADPGGATGAHGAGTGSNVAAVTELLATLRRATPIDTAGEALGRVAITLAARLDNGAGMDTAAVSRELRSTIAQLTKDGDGDDDDDWTSALPAAVWDAKEP